MQHEVKIPSLGESIVSGILTQWNCKNGDTVKKGDMLYELETDKITSEGTAEVSGVIELLVDADAEVDIGQVVARITESAEGDSEAQESEAADDASEPDEASEPKETADAESSDSEEDDAQTDDSDSPKSERHPPSVERIAATSGIDPSTVKGTGKAGRVTKADMLKASEQQAKSDPEQSTAPDEADAPKSAPAKAEAPAQASPSSNEGSSAARTTRKRMSPIRRKIAERLVAVKNEAAILTTFNEVDMSAVMQLRKQMQEDFVATHGVKLGFMSFFVKAAVSALKAVPGVNAQIEGDEVITNHFYDIGVAVGTDRGLVVPVLRDCDQLGFAGIEQQLSQYAQRAKEGKISIDDLQGGVFTISNGGVYGSLLSTPILNPPQSGILGMHSIQERPVAINGEVQIRPMMYLALSYDHRIVDGKEAVTFLIHIKNVIENPSRLLFAL